MNLRSLSKITNDDILAGQTVIVRVDYNVPLFESDGRLKVKNDQRIFSSKATIDWLRARGNKVVLLSHLGRPKGEFEAKYSLQPVADYLNNLGWWNKVEFCSDLVSEGAVAAVADLTPGSVVLMENVRFYPGEKKNDPFFISQLSRLGQFFVNEAFSSSHRAHASVCGLAKVLPSFAGFALEAEVEALEKVVNEPVRPLTVVVGGAKISDKVDAIVNLAQLADHVLVGGGIANNFLKAADVNIFNSYVQDVPADSSKDSTNYVSVAQEIMTANPGKIIMPTDVVAGPALDSDSGQRLDLSSVSDSRTTVDCGALMYLDIGPQTSANFQKIIAQSGTVFWNGPMGVFENTAFASGTASVAKAVAEANGISIIGGGDTISAAATFGVSDQVDYVSTAGSAGLEFLAGKKLPGLEVLI